MTMLVTLVTIIHVFVSVILVITVLLQPGKGGDLGSMFGGGMSESIFGSSGAVPFLTKATRVLAVLFILTSLTLGYFATQNYKSSVIKDSSTIEAPESKELIPDEIEQIPADATSIVPPDEQSKSASDDDQQVKPDQESKD